MIDKLHSINRFFLNEMKTYLTYFKSFTIVPTQNPNALVMKIIHSSSYPIISSMGIQEKIFLPN